MNEIVDGQVQIKSQRFTIVFLPYEPLYCRLHETLILQQPYTSSLENLEVYTTDTSYHSDNNHNRVIIRKN